MREKKINTLFLEKIETLEKSLPELRKGVNCAELTLINIIDILGD